MQGQRQQQEEQTLREELERQVQLNNKGGELGDDGDADSSSSSMRSALVSISERAIKGARLAVPGWSGLDAERFKCRIITGGLTNKLNLVHFAGDGADVPERSKALVRIFGQGTDEFIDRESESIVCRAMSSTGIAPRVYGIFPGGRAEEFIDNAQSVRNTDLHRPQVLTEVARLMALMHNVNLEDPQNAGLQTNKSMTCRMLRRLWDGACRARFDVDASKALKLAALQVGLLAHEIDWLENQFREVGMGKVLCHRDLQSGNVMVQGDMDANNIEKVFLIDFEYSGEDYVGFDFGNTFCEMSINNFSSRFPGFVLDPDMYPSKEVQRSFFSTYLEHLRDPVCLFPGHDALSTEQQIDKLVAFSELGALASHMQWALWGIVQAEHSSIDFGYLEYATARMDQYAVLRRDYEYKRRRSFAGTQTDAFAQTA